MTVANAATASITGTVTDTADNPLSNINITLYYWNGRYWQREESVQTANQTGIYEINGLSDGTYRICFSDPDGQFASECYDDHKPAFFQSGKNVNVTDGTTTSGIDAQLGKAAHITGTVSDLAGQPLPNVFVNIYARNGSWWEWINGVSTTSTNGQYDVGGLPAGTYKLCFRDTTGQYVNECYDDDTDNPESGLEITINTGQVLSGVDSQLAVAGHITGTVTDSFGNPLSNIEAHAYLWNGSWWENQGFSHSTDTSGSYDIGGLRGGTYRICLSDPNGQLSSECYDGQNPPFPTNSTDINVTAGSTTSGINVQLEQAAHITGTVTDLAGQPMVGITVNAYSWNGSSWQWINAVASDSITGHYDVGGLPAGTYKLCFRDFTGLYINECYDDDTDDPESGFEINLSASQVLSGIDSKLAVAGHITGTVTDPSGNPLTNINVYFYQWDGSRWEQ